jgi:multidrug efflux system membrane fusion protein
MRPSLLAHPRLPEILSSWPQTCYFPARVWIPETALANFFRRQFVLSLLLAVVGLYALYFIAQGLFAYSRAAYVTTDYVRMAPQVSGALSVLHVVTDQRVEAGDPLFSIDPTPYQIDVNTARAALHLAEVNKTVARDELDRAAALLASADAALGNAQSELDRAEELHQRGDLAQAALETVQTTQDRASAARRAAEAARRVAM